MGFDHVRTADGGFAMVGISANPQNGESDVYFVKADRHGEVEWDAYYGGDLGEAGYALTQLPDGGYAIVGYTRSFGAGEDDWYFVRIDPNGEELWTRTFGGGHYDACYSIKAHDNGDFTLFGHTWSFGAGEKDFYLVRTDSEGEMIWEQTYGGADFDFGRDHIVTSDGGYAMVGYAMSIGAGGKNMGLYRADPDGEEMWAVAFGNDDNEDCYSIVQTSDGGFALAGYRSPDPENPDNSNAWLVKTNSDGEMEWEAEYGGDFQEEWRDVALTDDGGFILTGYAFVEGQRSFDLLVGRYNADGELLWTKTQGEELAESGSSVVTNADGFSICGDANFGESNQVWLIQYEPENIVSYILAIPAGWNFISSPVIPLDDGFESLWSPVVERGNLRIAKDSGGRAYLPRLDENDIEFWDNRYGYVVYLFDADSLEFRGSTMPAQTPIPLDNGWTVAAYLPEQPQPAEDAFNSISEHLSLVKDDHGRFYLPEYDFSNLGLLQQGKAYLIDVDADCHLIWSEAGELDGVNADEHPMLEHFTAAIPTGSNMSLLLMADDPALTDARELGVFNDAGDCVGATAFVNGKAGLAVWSGDGSARLSEGDSFSLKLWDGAEEFPAEVRWIAGQDRFASNGLTVGKMAKTNPAPEGFALLKIHPNPFNSTTTLTFTTEISGDVSLEVFNLSGRLVDVILNKNTTRGVHNAVWNAEHQPAGVYLMRLKTPDQTIVQKAILAK